jgi:uncharacterized Rmd1/YagE family protein
VHTWLAVESIDKGSSRIHFYQHSISPGQKRRRIEEDLVAIASSAHVAEHTAGAIIQTSIRLHVFTRAHKEKRV